MSHVFISYSRKDKKVVERYVGSPVRLSLRGMGRGVA